MSVCVTLVYVYIMYLTISSIQTEQTVWQASTQSTGNISQPEYVTRY